jgi:hypothetical protein
VAGPICLASIIPKVEALMGVWAIDQHAITDAAAERIIFFMAYS